MEGTEDGRSFTACEICGSSFTGLKPYEEHVKGKKHRKKLSEEKILNSLDKNGESLELEDLQDAELRGLSCDICKTTFNGIIPYTQHLRSKTHEKSLLRKHTEKHQIKCSNNVNKDLPSEDVNLNKVMRETRSKPYGLCLICKKEFNGPKPYCQHVKCKSHTRRTSEKKILTEICNELKASKDISEVNVTGDSQNEKNCMFAYSNFINTDEVLKCTDCQKTFIDTVSLHFSGRAHAQRQTQNELLQELQASDLSNNCCKLEDQEADERGMQNIEQLVDTVLMCDICSVRFSGTENAKARLRSKRHIEAIKYRRQFTRTCKSSERDENKSDHEMSTKPEHVEDHELFTDGCEEITKRWLATSKFENAPDEVTHGNETCIKKCFPFDHVGEEFPRTIFSKEDFLSITKDNISKHLLPSIFDDSDEIAMETSSGSHDSENESGSVEIEDMDFTICTKNSDDGDICSGDTHRGFKRKYRKAEHNQSREKIFYNNGTVFD